MRRVWSGCGGPGSPRTASTRPVRSASRSGRSSATRLVSVGSRGRVTGAGTTSTPRRGTIFHKSSTSLHLWFYAMYLMTSTRCGVSAKQLERELGVTYKCAWRIFNRIRNVLMADDGTTLRGDVEADETSVDGKPRKPHGRSPFAQPGVNRRSEAMKLRERSRATVFAAVERGGRVKADRPTVPARPEAQGNADRVGRAGVDHRHRRVAGVQRPGPALHRPQSDQPLLRRLRRRRHPYEHDRGVLRALEACDPRHLPQGLAPLAPGVSQRVHVPVQRAWRTSADVRAATPASGRHLSGLAGLIVAGYPSG